MCPINAPRPIDRTRGRELDRTRSTIGAARALGWKDGVRDASYTRDDDDDDATCRDEGRCGMDASSEDDARDDASSSVVVIRG